MDEGVEGRGVKGRHCRWGEGVEGKKNDEGRGMWIRELREEGYREIGRHCRWGEGVEGKKNDEGRGMWMRELREEG